MTYTDNYELVPNLRVRVYVNENNVVQIYEIFPCAGYVLRVYSLDEYLMDDEGNYIFDENGDKILVRPCRTWGGATARSNYDWTTNPKGFAAELYTPDMEVNEEGKPKPEIM
jgi:hypothetical protein